jgi:galactokinase
MNSSELTKYIASYYEETFQQKPVLVFSPGRINIIGEHTDYNDGFVFPAAIDKGIYLAINVSENNTSTAIALDLEEQHEFSTDQELHPLINNGWENYVLGVVSEIQKKGKQVPNFNIVVKGDIPHGSGLSSSAALENAVVFGLNNLFDLNLTKEEMIFISQKAEHNFVGVKCGIMDQFASMFGQKNKALHLDCRNLHADSYVLDLGNYELVLINTNIKHSLADSAYNDRRTVCQTASDLLGVKALRDTTEQGLKTIASKISKEDFQKALYVVQENQRTLDAVEALKSNDISVLGGLLFASHKGLSEQYNVSCEELDFLVEEARNSPAVIGSRMMGGGFGGCTLNLVSKEGLSEFKELIDQKYFDRFGHRADLFPVQISNGTHLVEA